MAGTPEGNAEANLCLTRQSAMAVFVNLGLRRLDQAPPIGEGRLQSIAERTDAARARPGCGSCPPAAGCERVDLIENF